MQKILGLDISSSTIGWGILGFESGTIKLLDYGNIKPPKSNKGSLCFRISETYDIMSNFIAEKSPDHICIEAYANKFSSGKSTARTIIVLSVFNELVGMACLKNISIDPNRYAVSTIRSTLSKYSGIKISSKDDVFDYIQNNFLDFKIRKNRNSNIAKECYDEADAIAVALAYIIKEVLKNG